ncbi:MAG: glycosyltransferase [Propionibacteriales bacterium]|nr:glycosyltransferase [Propionibacteriales bacterium]
MSAVGSTESGSRQSGEEEAWSEDAETVSNGAGLLAGSAGGFGILSDGHAVAHPGQRMTLGTYFNAFPASYWRRWTNVEEVTLRATVSGHGTFLVYRSTSKGHVLRSASKSIDSDDPVDVEVTLPLKPFIDGGWYWFDVEAADREMVVHSGEWLVETERTTPGTITIGITTFNQPTFCVDQLAALANSQEVLDVLDEIVVVDQGTQHVRDHELFTAVSKVLGERLRVIEQGNLGGSGGFSRSMMEAVDRGQSDYVLLFDDDVQCEPEGILRAIAFADLAKTPTAVGGQMFSLYDRSVMHAYGETVKKYRWFWGPAPETEHGHNFARKSLQGTKWLHRRIDVDYNGWWMCLIPTSVIREIGLSLPMFIKWDDAEFGLRAQEAGYPTVTLPGVAVWHVPWHEKDDTIDWQAYLHRRNRLVAALLHSPYSRGGRLVWESFQTQIRHLMSMQYAPAEMGLMAIEDILDGPNRMHHDVLYRVPEVRELRKSYPDSQMKPALDEFPAPRRVKPPRKGKGPQAPGNRVAQLKALALGGLRQLQPIRSTAVRNPEATVPHMDLRWWLLSQLDSALVSSADGTSAAWYQRDPEQFRDLLRRSVTLHVRLYEEWPKLVNEYQRALPDLVSPDAWRKTFEQSMEPGPGA